MPSFPTSAGAALRALALASFMLSPVRAAFAADTITVDHAWARATPGPVRTGAAYLTVTVTTPDHLLSAQTPVAARTELHTMTMDGQVMKMRAVPEGFDIEPGKPLVLGPDGVHVMLIGLANPLKPGQTFPLTLTFRKAGSVQTTVTVGPVGAMGPGQAGTAPMPGPMPGMKM